jgi:hypothetical protein
MPRLKGSITIKYFDNITKVSTIVERFVALQLQAQTRPKRGHKLSAILDDIIKGSHGDHDIHYHNPSVGLATKARGCKVVGQEEAQESCHMLPGVQESVRE